jgi:hypothetical protein
LWDYNALVSVRKGTRTNGIYKQWNFTQIISKNYLSIFDFLNQDSLKKLDCAMVEPSLADAKPGDKFQFVRTGYFCVDTKLEGTFNRIVGLKDSFPAKK